MSDPSRPPVPALADALRVTGLSATELPAACRADAARLTDGLRAVVWRGAEAVRATARAGARRLGRGAGAAARPRPPPPAGGSPPRAPTTAAARSASRRPAAASWD